MVWTTLGTALENALASMMDDGEGAAATASDAVKRTATEAAAKFQGRNSPEEAEPKICMSDSASRERMNAALPTGRHRYTGAASPKAAKGSPARPVYLCLIVDNGGGRRQEEGTSAAFRAQAGGGDPRRELLKLVVG